MKKSIAVLLMAGLSFGAIAAERDVPVTAQKSLTMTIYNQGRALVKDTRNVDLTSGKNTLAFSGISDQIMAETALLKGSSITVTEQNFNFDLLDYDSLMRTSVGSMVDVEYINPGDGAVSRSRAQLLAYDEKPVLKIGDKIETDYPGRVVFNSIPANLRSKPTLTIDLNAAKPGAQDLELSYLTKGLSWKADYVAELDETDKKMGLVGYVTLTNNTHVSFPKSELQLVAGDVNVVYNRAPMMEKARGAVFDAEGVTVGKMASESIGDYYLYTLKEPTDILSNQTKQVSLLSSPSVKVEKIYKVENAISLENTTEFKKIKPSTFLNFKNKTEEGLGMPLPKGIVRVYKKDSKSRLIFMGEDNIQHTAKNQEVELRMGNAFDLTAKGKRTGFIVQGKDAFEVAYSVTIENGGTTAQAVRFYQDMPSGWKILSESIVSVRENANRVYWNVTVPAEGQATFDFKVQVQKKPMVGVQ